MPSDVILLLRHLLLLKGVLMSPLCSFVTPLPCLCSFKGVLSFIFSDSLSLCFSHPCNGFSLAPWHFSFDVLLSACVLLTSLLKSQCNCNICWFDQHLSFVWQHICFYICDVWFIFENSSPEFWKCIPECFASEPCFQHYSGWSFLSFLLLLHFIPVALCPMSFSSIPIIFEACDTLIISAGLLISLSLLKSFWFSTLDLTDLSSDDLFCFSLKDSSFQHLQHLPLSMMSKCSIPRGTMQ